jgi:hypothetical protein
LLRTYIQDRREDKEYGHAGASDCKVNIWIGRFAKAPGEVAAHLTLFPVSTSNSYQDTFSARAS